MANRHKENGKWVYDDDDGRTIADMSGVRHRNIMMPNRFDDEIAEPIDSQLADEVKEGAACDQIPGGRPETDPGAEPAFVEEDGVIMEPGEAGNFRPWEQRETKSENAAWVFGALSAGLLLVLIFVAAGALIISLMIWAWT